MNHQATVKPPSSCTGLIPKKYPWILKKMLGNMSRWYVQTPGPHWYPYQPKQGWAPPLLRQLARHLVESDGTVAIFTKKRFGSFSPPSGSCLPFFHQPETPKKKLKLHAFHVESLKNTFHLKEAGLVSYQNISPFARIIRSTPWLFSCLKKFEVLPIFFKVF